jgi:hypothetical protein
VRGPTYTPENGLSIPKYQTIRHVSVEYIMSENKMDLEYDLILDDESVLGDQYNCDVLYECTDKELVLARQVVDFEIVQEFQSVELKSKVIVVSPVITTVQVSLEDTIEFFYEGRKYEDHTVDR